MRRFSADAADLQAARLIVDRQTRTAYQSMFGRPARRKAFPVAPIPECPPDARSHLLLSVKSDPYADCASLADVARSAQTRRDTVTSAIRGWTICRLCTDQRMAAAWLAFERRRKIAELDSFIVRDQLADKFLHNIVFTADQAATDLLRSPRTGKWRKAWDKDLDSAVERLVGVLARNPTADRINYLPGVACDDMLATISGALRAFKRQELGLRDSLPKRERPNAERRAFAVTLTRWCRQFLAADCQSIVAVIVRVLFGCAYSERQLRRDIADTSSPTT